MPEKQEVERWKNVTRGKAFVLKYDRYHNLTSELVGAGQFITLTKEEREINQERAANDKLDIFKNGILGPVRLIDPEDEKEFAENPNLVTDDDLTSMLKLPKKQLEAKLADMSVVYPVQRLHDLALHEDARVTTGNVAAIKARLEELKPPRVKMTSFADDPEF